MSKIYRDHKDRLFCFIFGREKFLLGQKAEVTDMFLTEYNEEETMNMLKEEAREEGLAEGRAEYKKALSLLRNGASSVEDFTSQGISEEVAKDVLGLEEN